jgi:hypothetical protein
VLPSFLPSSLYVLASFPSSYVFFRSLLPFLRTNTFTIRNRPIHVYQLPSFFSSLVRSLPSFLPSVVPSF